MAKTRPARATAELKDQQQQPDLVELQGRQAREPQEPNVNTRTTTPADFIAYPMAMKILREKWQATPEELAVWIYLGPKLGGIAAYLNANELSPPPQFSFAAYIGREEYLSLLMSCWFRRDDIDRFAPNERYVTGKQLLERWGKIPDIQAEAFIIAKIIESRLIDLHPISGGTGVTFSEQQNFPPLESGLFPLSHIEQIEAKDALDSSPVSPNSDAPVQDSAEKRYTKSVVKREARKLSTQDMYASWQKKYRELKRSKPGHSDSWYANQIAKLDIAKGRATETIRKNMKK